MAINLNAKKRTDLKGSTTRLLRESGSIPAVVYGNKADNTPITVDSIAFVKTMREAGRNGVINLSVEGSTYNVILSDYQQDFLKNEVTHADFLAVDMSAEIDADVQVTLVGNAQGVKDGGVLQQSLHEVSVTAKPSDIPMAVEFDISSLVVSDTVTVADLKTSASNYTINHEDGETVASILPPRQEEEIDSGEEQAEGTPENEEGREV
ncbi:50S ribosomal protein L25/general stress protein Ctc [Bacillus fonticola]|uniref:50S ribosomal protein L25/general stress protein Ctc n=1 Tax=Bacillus fonticola TaxID=2728853 RepID=UPI00147363BB|nr:50S ribosomal protein L25/general stress protein Ctc [Bacillus fonticola]